MASSRTPQAKGMAFLVVGLLAFVLSTVVPGGFLRGLLQGVTVALMVLAAYLLGTTWRRGRAEPGSPEGDPGEMWLPSRDEHRE